MNTDKLESTRSVSLNKKATSAHDLNELSDRELQLVTGGNRGNIFCAEACYYAGLTQSQCNEYCRTGVIDSR